MDVVGECMDTSIVKYGMIFISFQFECDGVTQTTIDEISLIGSSVPPIHLFSVHMESLLFYITP